jgi:uncharacterized protein
VWVSWLEAIAVFAAGVAAGTINTVVGSGSLITFPTLVALGYPPLISNVSNNIGLVPGSISGVIGYRRELAGQAGRLRRLLPASAIGGLVGATLLLVLPSDVFDRVVIALIALALVLVVIQPRIARRNAARRADGSPAVPRDVSPTLVGLVGLAGVYGGYFGAAQGVVLIALLGIFVDDDLQRLNATKNMLTTTVNSLAAVVFIVATEVDWAVVALIAAGSTIGGQVGAKVGRRLDPRVLRGVIVVVGVSALIRLITAL